jgi:hypothetical protein
LVVCNHRKHHVKDHKSSAAQGNQPNQRKGAGSFPASRQTNRDAGANRPSRAVPVCCASAWREKVVSEIVLISHANAAFAGARDLRTAQDGILLAITRKPLFCAATRLREEGFGDDTVIIIRDANDAAPDVCGKIGNVLM